jgi:repressor LexA
MNEPIRPTKKQRELLTFIEQFIGEHGYSPSYREIMNGLKYTSVATVALHVNNLIKRGHLRKRDHSARSLEVVGAGGQPKTAGGGEQSGAEKWFVEKVEHLFTQTEQTAQPAPIQLGQLRVLVDALVILGLEDEAQKFDTRLSGLRQRLPQTQM